MSGTEMLIAGLGFLTLGYLQEIESRVRESEGWWRVSEALMSLVWSVLAGLSLWRWAIY